MERPYPFLSDDGGKFHLISFHYATRAWRDSLFWRLKDAYRRFFYTREQRIFNKIRVLALNEI